MAAYPIAEFSREVVLGAEFAFADEDHLAAVRKCWSGKSAALVRAGIKAP